MPTYQLLTDRSLAQASAITPTTLIHIVYTGDPSQNIAGSSYKAELQQLSSIFSGGTDTLVTGGTYSAGTITFTNSSGGTFPVTGLTDGSYYLPLSGGTVSGATNFTNGLTANTMSASTLFVNGVQITGDTFVTGGTYSTGTILFTNNQNGQFSVTGITSSGTTFTGGSGNCIADLYVTNIHGCSPITIYDSIKSTGTTVSGLTSFSFGFETSATTDYSFAIGLGNIASETGSTAQGYYTTSSGVASNSEGVLTLASGVGSHSEGYETKSFGDYSHSEGYQTSASTNSSHSEGNLTNALGNASHAEGTQTIASGTSSHAEGWNTIAGGQNSHAEGSGTTSVGISSHAEGFGAISIGNYSHAEGSFTRSTNTGSHAEGSGTTASGTHSHAEGISTSATTQGAHAEGVLTLASDDGAHAEGYLTIASDFAAHSEGSGTTASAFYSHSEGVGTIASGDGSHSEGFGTIASGTYSHAEGRETKSIATYSHAAGRETIAKGSYQSVIGQWNLTAVTESAFIIGNGTSDLNRGNLLFAGNNEVNISGKTITTNLQMTSGATTGYVLKSLDNNGNAEWSPTVKEVYYKTTESNAKFSNNLNIYAGTTNGSTDVIYTTGIIPEDFGSLISSKIIAIPEFTASESTFFRCDYSQTNNSISGNNLTANVTYNYVENETILLDVQNVMSGLTANDIFSVRVFQNNADLFVLGLKLKYQTT